MNCDIVRDLLPLYADGLSSDVSNKAIENHIKTCPACRTLTEQMRTPIEPEPVDEATACINALHAQRRKNHRRIIIACAATVLVCVLSWWIYMETHFRSEKLVTVTTDGDQILAEIPELALTQAELELADVILDIPVFQNIPVQDESGNTISESFASEELRNLITPYLPDGAVIGDIGHIGYAIYVDYFHGDQRVILEYLDGDSTGHVDMIRKTLGVLEFSDPIDGVEFVPDVQVICSLEYEPATGITRYEKKNSRHIWFGFLNV